MVFYTRIFFRAKGNMLNHSTQHLLLAKVNAKQNSSFYGCLHKSATSMFVVGICIATPAQAQLNSEVLRPFLGLYGNYDSNVLGLNSPEAALASNGSRALSDTSWTAYAGVDYRQLFGRQTVTANVSRSRTAFDRLSQLDYRGENFSSDLAWQLGNYWNGNAGFTRAVALAPFTDFHGLESNTIASARRHASAAWRFHPAWQVHAEVSRYAIDYSVLLQSQYDRTENQGVLGVDYTSRAGSTFGVRWRSLDGRFPNQILGTSGLANDYRQHQLELKSDWQFSGKSRVNFLGSVVSRLHNVLPERDFRGYNGRMTLTTAVGGATSLTAAAWRETGIFDDVSTAYSTNRGAQLGARWSATSKFTVEGSAKREYRDFTRSLRFSTLPDYRDVLHTNQLTLKYLPLDRLNMEFILFSSGKANNSGIGGYARHGASFSSRYMF